MRPQIIFIFLFSSLLTLGQEKGIYYGSKTQMLQYFLTINDSVVDVECFQEKGSQIFGHIPAIELEAGLESYKSKAIYKSQDNQIRVYTRKKYLLLKSKNFGNFKMYKTSMTKKDIENLRERHYEFRKMHKVD
ncbi:MAG: hypothetical protein ACI9XP_001205 [Lentimonas sp.]|jgi:hypothetical protein